MERWLAMASGQHGLITRQQMRNLGFTVRAIEWKIEVATIEEVLPGVYRVGGSARTWEQRVRAACLWGGPGACASHKSAAALWQLDGFGPGPVEISTLKQNRAHLSFKVHRTLVEPAFTTSKLGIPVTNAFRTVRDVVGIVSEDRSNQVLDEALRKGLVSMDALRRMVDREKRSRRLLVAAGIEFVEEFVVSDDKGNFVARVDFKLVGSPVVVESDGRANHSSKLDWQHDLDRRNLLTALGLGVIHVTWHKVMNRPDEFLAEVRDASTHRPWPPPAP
jgi:very-short-patch-repair endonuclease